MGLFDIYRILRSFRIFKLFKKEKELTIDEKFNMAASIRCNNAIKYAIDHDIVFDYSLESIKVLESELNLIYKGIKKDGMEEEDI